MNIEEYKQTVKDKFEADMDAINSLPELPKKLKDKISYIGSGADLVQICNVDNFDEVLDLIRGEKYELQTYFMCGGMLCVTYRIGEVSYMFSVDKEHEAALEKLSGGNCHFEFEKITRTEKTISCGL